MAAQVTISQLPAAGPLTGTELVPVVQNGGTVKTTVADIAASPNNTQSFLTAVQEPTLANSRYLQGNNGVTTSDGGAQNPLVVELTGAALQFFNAPAGLIAKPTATTVAARTLLSGGSGLSITNGNGVAGNPTIALAGRNAALESLSGSSGLVALSGSGLTSVDILGTANQISVANGAGPGNPTIGIANNPVLPGTAGFVPPTGTTAQRPALPDPGTIRYNTDISNLEVYDTGTGWTAMPGGAITLINTGTGLTGGPITSAGTISIANTGIGAGTYGLADHVPQLVINAQGQVTNGFNIPIAISYTQVSGLGTAAVLDAGVANGVATLDGSGTVPTSQLPSAVLGAVSYQGTWDASTNTPTLASGVGTKGYYYVVDVAGSTDLDGITDWKIGDWAIFNGSVWQKIDNTDAVTSVNGYTGTVVLSYSDVGAPSTTGTDATGTWNIGISGNAATVTNGVYTTGSYADPTWITSLATSKLSGTVAVANGGTNLSSYTVGDLLYASGATTLSKLGIGSGTYLLTSSGSAPQWSDPAGVSVGSATNATNTTNVAISASSTNADFYLTFVSTNTGNLPEYVASGLTVNPSTGKITGGIAGGTF